MSVFRLLTALLLLVTSAAVASAQSPAQSSSEKNRVTAPNFLDPGRIEDYQPHLNHFVLPPEFRSQPRAQPQGDTFCYSIRSYQVARDNPHSDSTHPVKYSTCQPSARFTVHTIEMRNSASPY
ncbi:MAG TPA: hypothetical protein VMU61_10935 [Candidatus Aquilonibacter sp.]|nr:hypothetical protein [Candidatus Aquilonibacter sp.]